LTTLKTDRLMLRPVQFDDAPAFEAFYSEPEVMAIRKYGVLDAGAACAKVRSMTEHWTVHGFGMWVVEEIASGDFAGECGLRWLEDGSDVELSYGLYTRFRGRGLATEAARAAVEFGFSVLGLKRIVALSRGDNIVSHRILEKIGMTLEWRKPKGEHGLVRYLLVSKNEPTGRR
jgi:ribosomal-protein-alanine N-acetyltransferase